MKSNPKTLADETRTNAVAIAELRLQCEKLLYRVQQVERREKSARTTIAQLRRELNSLKKQTATASERPAPSAARAVEPHESPAYPKIRNGSSSDPDFTSALKELN